MQEILYRKTPKVCDLVAVKNQEQGKIKIILRFYARMIRRTMVTFSEVGISWEETISVSSIQVMLGCNQMKMFPVDRNTKLEFKKVRPKRLGAWLKVSEAHMIKKNVCMSESLGQRLRLYISIDWQSHTLSVGLSSSWFQYTSFILSAFQILLPDGSMAQSQCLQGWKELMFIFLVDWKKTMEEDNLAEFWKY